MTCALIEREPLSNNQKHTLSDSDQPTIGWCGNLLYRSTYFKRKNFTGRI